MTISLYAHGPAKIEVGQYNMKTLQDAQNAFLETCRTCDCKPEGIKSTENKVIVNFADLDENLWKLLNQVAKVNDCHGDPPSLYTLVVQEVKEGEYVKTGSYND
jgi:hypothetical protein